MPLVHYLAYGSNLHPLRFAKRVPSAQIIGRIELAGYQIAFHKKGKDGSGKCLFYKTGDKAHIMYGALYSFDSREKKELDRHEGKEYGYTDEVIDVDFGGVTYSPYVYVAQSPYVDTKLAPFDWYKAYVVAGARYHAFPDDYVACFEAVPSAPDPDVARSQEHEAVLATSLGAHQTVGQM